MHFKEVVKTKGKSRGCVERLEFDIERSKFMTYIKNTIEKTTPNDFGEDCSVGI